MFLPKNERLPAGSPMVFACVWCWGPIIVPESYIRKPAICSLCGGEWSEIKLSAKIAIVEGLVELSHAGA